MTIQVPDYNGKDRRENGMKARLDWKDHIPTVFTVVGVVVTALLGWQKLKDSVQVLAQANSKLERKVEKVEEKYIAQSQNLEVIKNDTLHIQKDIDQLQEQMKEDKLEIINEIRRIR